MNVPRHFTTPPMPGVREKLIYVSDLKAAVNRLDTCWNKTQLEDILNSVKFFVQQMEK